MVRGGTDVLLRLPSGSGWRFRADGGAISLERSVYVGDGRNVNRAGRSSCRVTWAARGRG